ncbi:MAG: MFS transporter [Roseburia sp.]
MNQKLTNKLKRNIGLDYINTFLSNLNMQSSIWVLYLAYCGLNLAQIGVLEGIYHATSILCEVPSGAAADLLGRKRCMILSKVCIAVSCIIMLFAKDFGWFALSFAIQAFGNNLNSGSEEALVYDSMKCLGQEERYMGVYGKLNVLIEVSQGIATVAGGVLAEYSYFWCYAACVVIGVLALLPVLFMTETPREEKQNEERGKNTVWGTVKQHFATSAHILRSDVRIRKVIGFYSVIFAAHTLLFFYSQQYYAELGYDKIQISLILLLVGGASCLGAIISERIFHRLGKKCIIPAAGMIAVACLCYGIGNAVVSVAAFMLAGFANAVLYPVQSDSLNALIPSEQRATLISVDSMCFSIAMILLFPAAGAVADRWGLEKVLALFGAVLLIFLFAFLRFGKEIFSSEQA